MSRQITVSMSLLRDLMFGFDSLADITAQSVTNAGPETYFPIIIPKEVGKILSELNTDKLFHIHHFPTHSEVWHVKHWADSNSRRWELISKSAADTETWNLRQQEVADRNNKILKIKELITARMPAFAAKSMEPQLLTMAITLSRMPAEQCDIIPGLKEILYGSTNTTTSSTNQ